MAWRSCLVRFGPTGGGDLIRNPVKRSRWPHSFQQRCGFRKVSKKTELKKMENPGPAHTESPKSVVQHQNPAPTVDREARAFSRLIRPFFFTVGFTGCSFSAAAVWQYESLKSQVQRYFNEAQADWLEKIRPQKRGHLRKEINQWWQSLTEGQRTVTGIIAANAVVFCCWRVRSLHPFMVRYFTANPASKTLCTPMLLSTFSHFSFFHMAVNMYVLWSFSSSAVHMLGREQFTAVYLSAGVFSTFISYVCKMSTGRFGPSLGASGAIMTVLAAVCTKVPEAKLAIIFLPMFTFTAANALKAIVAMDTVGLVLGWTFFDHAAHLGGAVFGMWYVLVGHQWIWMNRESFIKFWHELRTRRGGGPGGSA